MRVFRDFELEALRLILHNVVTPAQMSLIEGFTGAANYDYTGWGYYLTISDPALPVEPWMLHEPFVVGNSGLMKCGFLAFLGDNELTLECFPLGSEELGAVVPIPADFREQAVSISTPPINVSDGPDAT